MDTTLPPTSHLRRQIERLREAYLMLSEDTDRELADGIKILSDMHRNGDTDAAITSYVDRNIRFIIQELD